MARDVYALDKTMYPKDRNKWFDGYNGQQVIIVDDIDKSSKCLSGHLKDWADHYPRRGEIKGGAVPLQHGSIVVTSQYSIDDLWSS